MTAAAVSPETQEALRARARDYLRANGTLAPASAIRRRVATAFETLDKLLRGVDPTRAGRRVWPDEWSVHEIADHLVETHRPSRDELRELLAGRRPAGPPIPAALQSADPFARAWPTVLDELASVHGDIVKDLAAVPDTLPTDVHARVLVVINAEAVDGSTVPLTWEDEIDWKSYAVFLRLHAIDHLNQARKVLAQIEGRRGS